MASPDSIANHLIVTGLMEALIRNNVLQHVDALFAINQQKERIGAEMPEVTAILAELETTLLEDLEAQQ